MSIYITELLVYVEAYYALNTFIVNPYLERSNETFTNIMPIVSKCLSSFENLSGTNEKLIN